jgi:hypothetical protein
MSDRPAGLTDVLVEILLDMLLFLEFEEPSEIDEQRIVKQFELLDFQLGALDGPDRARLGAMLRAAAGRECLPAQLAWVESFIEAEGLVPPAAAAEAG